MVSVTLYGFVFYDARLYADMGLQVLYFALASYGWWAWLHGGKDHGELAVSRTPAARARTAATSVSACSATSCADAEARRCRRASSSRFRR